MTRHVLALTSSLLFLGILAIAQSKPLTNNDVLQMSKGGFDEQTIVKAIEANQPNFDTSVSALVALKGAGVSERVIDAMLEAEAKGKNPPAAATPAKDPNVPDDVGVYAMFKGKLVEVEPEIVGWRTGGMMKASFGFSRGHVNAEVQGKESPLRLTTPVEFVIRCPEGTAVTEYQLLRLDKKGNRREFRAMTGGVLHASGGAEKNAIPFKWIKVAPRTYRITLPELKRGEYGFLPPGAMSSNIASSGKIYSFGVIE